MELPKAPSAATVALRGDYAVAGPDYAVKQAWERYSADEHARWGLLLDRQLAMVKRYGAVQFLAGLEALALTRRIPRFDEASRTLRRASGWEIVAVPGLIPEEHFFAHLAQRRFPVTVWLRNAAEMDYLVEPDVFHDFFGHVPLLCDPVFADFVHAYGVAGAKAAAGGGVKMLARLYWYSVEFGLIKSGAGLRSYGAGILSSAGETPYSIDSPRPHRIGFDLERVMRTDYLIDAFQQTYFVIDSFEQLFRDSYDRDFLPVYRKFRDVEGYAPDTLLPTDVIVTRGTQGEQQWTPEFH